MMCSQAVVAALLAIVALPPGICEAQNLLSGPQKIVIDTAHDRLLVSNYNTGDIVQIDSEGNQSYFVPGAEFIDGMEIIGDTVYGAASNKRIKGYDLNTGEMTISVTVSGTGYLSSLIADDAGHLYISCPLGNTIYKLRISDESYWTFVEGNGLDRPNGILFQEAEDRLLVIEDKPNPRILEISMADSAVTTVVATSLAGADGIAEDAAGNYYVAGYYLPGVYKFDPTFTEPPEMIFSGNGIVYPTYDASDNSLLVTLYNANSWARIPLEPTGTPIGEESEVSFHFRNCPNPAKRGTTIRFELPDNARTRLEIYGISGRLVRTLTDEVHGPGPHSIAWDGRDDSGTAVASGTYYLRLRINDTQYTQAALLTN